MENFNELKLSPAISRAIQEMGYTKPTPIQAMALPFLMSGPTDFLGMAATGTGKTAAFGIPLLERIDPNLRVTQALILCPTRELTLQVAEQITLMGKHKRVHAQPIYGGAGYSEQIRGMKRGAYIIVATPGRLIDHIEQGNLSLDLVRTVVLDEADEMISRGFKEALEFILKHLPKEECNVWLFAATMNSTLRRVADRYLQKPKLAHVNRTEMLSGTVKQIYFTVREKNKAKGLCKLIDAAEDFYSLIFCQTKSLVMELTEYLKVHGYRADCLHGEKSQTDRERTLKLFRERNVSILVCTDVAARGLDVKDVSHVINYSLPRDLDSYVHRIGRTARSGKGGLALSLVTPNEVHLIERFERATRSQMEPGIFPTKKEISKVKLERLHPKFSKALGFERASEVLDETWKASLESMSKTEIAGRFLALALPELFDDREKAEELGLHEFEHQRKPKRDRFIPHSKLNRRPWKKPDFRDHRRDAR